MNLKFLKITLLIFTLFCFTNNSEAKKYKFKDDNYSIKLDKSWEINNSYGSSGLAQMFFSEKYKQSLIIRKLPALVLENSKLPSDKKEFISFLKKNYLKKQMEKMFSMMKQHFSINPIKIADYDSFLVNVMGNSKNTPITLSISVILENNNSGYLFTLVNIGHREVTEDEVYRATKDFKILKTNPKQKKIKLKKSNKTYKSLYYGYEAPFYEGMIQAKNSDLGLATDEATLNHIQIDLKHGSVFMISSFCNKEANLTNTQILSFFTSEIENILEPFTIQKDTNGEIYATGKLYDKDIEQLVYYYKVKNFSTCNHVIINFDTIDRGLEPLNQFIANIKPIQIDKSKLTEKNHSENDFIHATVLASLGQYLEGKGNADSIKFLKKATELAPLQVVFLDHYLSAVNNQGKYKDGIIDIQKTSTEISNTQNFQSWKAWFLAKTEETTEAISLYKKIFSKHYTTDDDFFSYLILLESKQNWETILSEINTHKDKVSKQKSLKLKLATTYAKADKIKEAKDVLQSITSSGNFDDYDIYEVLDVYYEVKYFDEGIELIKSHFENKEKDINSYYYLGDFQYNTGKTKQALESMKKALKFDPSNITIQNYISGINSQNGIGNIEIVKTPIIALTLPTQIQSDIKNQKLINTDRPVSNYYYINGYDFEEGKVFTKTYYRKFKINDLQSAEGIETLQVKFNQEYEHPYINKFTVKNLSTNAITELDVDTVYITSVNDGISADGDRFLNIPIPSIDNNTEIEYIISVQSNSKIDMFNFETDFFVSIYPYLYMASFVQGDVKKINSNHSDNIEFHSQKELKIWKSNQIDLYKQEAYRPEAHQTFQWVEITSTEKSWEKAGDLYLNKIIGKLGSDLSKGQLLSILPDSKDPVTITKELAAFVQSGITYQALEFGSRALIPNTTKQTLQNKYGDCKDHAVMLYDLLIKKGITAHLALVNTEEYINPDLVTLDQFNHVVVYLPNINGGIFIDTTDKYTAIDLKTPPRSVQGSMALILEKNSSKLISIPKITTIQNTLDIERSISHSNNLYLSKETAVITGYMASEIRAYLQPLTKEHIKTDISKWVNGYYPDLLVSDFSYYNLDKLDKPLIIEFSFQQDRNNTDFKVPAFLERVYLTYTAYDSRFYPFRFTESFSISSKTTTNDKTLKLNNLNDSYNSKPLAWSFKKSNKEQHFKASVNSGTYKANEYQLFFNSLKKVIYKIEKSILIKE